MIERIRIAISTEIVKPSNWEAGVRIGDPKGQARQLTHTAGSCRGPLFSDRPSAGPSQTGQDAMVNSNAVSNK